MSKSLIPSSNSRTSRPPPSSRNAPNVYALNGTGMIVFSIGHKIGDEEQEIDHTLTIFWRERTIVGFQIRNLSRFEGCVTMDPERPILFKNALERMTDCMCMTDDHDFRRKWYELVIGLVGDTMIPAGEWQRAVGDVAA